jgi:hypothetical protein
VLGGVIDHRMGQLQMRVDAVKKASLSAMIRKAKEDGVFDEEEAKRGISVMKKTLDMEEEMEAVDEEGNVIAGEKMKVSEGAPVEDESLGPIGKWLAAGMPATDAMKALGFEGGASKAPAKKEASDEKQKEKKKDDKVYTIALPARAPKQLLLDLKRVLETYPGSEPVQLKIGDQIITLPLTITASPLLEKKVEDILAAAANQ